MGLKLLNISLNLLMCSNIYVFYIPKSNLGMNVDCAVCVLRVHIDGHMGVCRIELPTK